MNGPILWRYFATLTVFVCLVVALGVVLAMVIG